MKLFLYKLKGAAALAICVCLFSSSIFAAEPAALSVVRDGAKTVVLTETEKEAEPLPILTESEALKKARKHSPKLREIQDTADFLQQSKEDLWDKVGSFDVPQNYDHQKWVNAGWYAVTSGAFTIQNNMEQTKHGRELQEMALEMTVKSSFTSILSMQDNLKLVQANAAMQEKLYQQGKVKHEMGLMSKYNLDQLQIAAEQARDTEAQLLDSLEQLYIKMNDLMGEKTDARFEYVYDVEYQPYTMTRTMEQFITDKTKNDPSIKVLELKVETAKFNKNYLSEADTGSSAEREMNLEKAERNLKVAKTNMELAIRNAYLQIGQLETAYASAQADLTKAQADYRAVQINYQAGNVTKTTVEQAEMGLLKAENALKELAYNHDMLIFTFENPYMLVAASQAAAQ